jgi:hypothetical protein
MPPEFPSTNPWVLWFKDAAERGLRAYAASFASLVGADQVFSKFDLAFWETLVAALVGLVVSTLLSLAGVRRGSPGSGSLLSAETEAQQGQVAAEAAARST